MELSPSFLLETDCIDIELQVTDVRAHDIDDIFWMAIGSGAFNLSSLSETNAIDFYQLTMPVPDTKVGIFHLRSTIR